MTTFLRFHGYLDEMLEPIGEAKEKGYISMGEKDWILSTEGESKIKALMKNDNGLMRILASIPSSDAIPADILKQMVFGDGINR